MTKERLEEILGHGEGIDIEFKSSQFELNRDTFESVCAFLNRKGGHLLLGVKNDGTVEGVLESCVQDMVNNIVTTANNPNKLNPPFYLAPQVIKYEGKSLIHVFVPESSLVHNTNGKIFDRNRDGDFDITKHAALVTQLYLRKQTTYSENRIYPYLRISDFKEELFVRVRNLARSQKIDHPWLELDNAELLRSAGLYKQDFHTGKHGYTLAAALLFGKDEVIQSIVPHYKTDALLRVENTDRYDDRDDIRTNLIESYDRLMAFVRKHLPDKFFQEGDQRRSLRDLIFREVVANLLIHREYMNPYPAKLVIEQDKVTSENWNRPHNGGTIDPVNFSPYPKNPVIARFFKEIGRADELGSGVRNTFKYCSQYTAGTSPVFIEEDVFMIIIPTKPANLSPTQITTQVTTQITTQVTTQATQRKILQLLKTTPSISRKDIAKRIGGISEDGVKYHLKLLKEANKIRRVGGTRGYWQIHDDI